MPKLVYLAAALVSAAMFLTMSVDSPVSAFDIPADEDGHVHDPGVAPRPTRCGTFVDGAEGSGSQTDPATYDYVTYATVPTNGDTPDHDWVHDTDGDFLVWNMGVTALAVNLYPSIDHTPVPEEALEVTVYGGPSAAGPWEAGNITTIFDQGFDPAWISDDYVSRWQFSQPYQYFAVGHGGPEAMIFDGDAEIDAVCVVDVTAPSVACRETVNPAGKNVPKSGPNAGNSGQNPDGFYELLARDDFDQSADIYVVDKGTDGVFGTSDDTTFGPFAPGTKIKYVEANGATPSQEPGTGVIDWKIKGQGDFGVFAVDNDGNVSRHEQCHVPPPPK